MPYGNRVFSGSGAFQEGDKFFYQRTYNDTTNSLTVGMPLYVDLTDAAEFNNANSTTQLSPAVSATGGKCVLGTNANAGKLLGVYAPENPNEKPAKGDMVRILKIGNGLISAQSPVSNPAGTVGTWLIASTAVNDAVTASAPSAGKTVGQISVTGAHITVGAQVFAASSATSTLVNGWIEIC